MAYKLIKGEFHIFYPDQPRQGPEPDGDTLKFLPDRPEFVEALRSPGGRSARFNGRSMVNLRFEGIDALATHYDDMHQNLHWAEAARDKVVELAGFRQVEFWDDLPYRVRSVADNPRPGYILTRSLDEFGRAISFVYPGEIQEQDGTDIFVDTTLLGRSINAKIVAAGLVYPAFYTSLPLDLKERLSRLTVRAWDQDCGLWPSDTANVLYLQWVPNLAVLRDLVIWPKLFRRLARYFASGHDRLAEFDSWLRADPTDRDDRVLLPSGEQANIHDVVETRGDWLRMRYWPEDLTVLPDQA